MDRRGFLDSVWRGGLLGLLLLLAGSLVWRKKVTLKGASCSGDFQCRYCREIGRCELPEADKARRDGKGNG